MAFFFATAKDLLPVLLSVESKIRIKYTPWGYFNSPNVSAFISASELPTLTLPAPSESAISCPRYLVTHFDTTVKYEKISRYDGSTVWCVSQSVNEDSIVFSHGGQFDEGVLLNGEVRTVHKTPAAQKLQQIFDTAIRNSFTKIRAFRVGKHAEDLLDAGVRLTGAKQSPEIYDLAR